MEFYVFKKTMYGISVASIIIQSDKNSQSEVRSPLTCKPKTTVAKLIKYLLWKTQWSRRIDFRFELLFHVKDFKTHLYLNDRA